MYRVVVGSDQEQPFEVCLMVGVLVSSLSADLAEREGGDDRRNHDTEDQPEGREGLPVPRRYSTQRDVGPNAIHSATK